MAVADIAQFQKALKEIKSCLLVLPQNPSLDTVAAGLSLSLALQKNGAPTVVSCPSLMIVEFNRLIGVEKVRENLGEDNLVITFDGYPADSVEKVTCGIEGDTFTLLVLPKPGNKAPRQEQIKSSYSGIFSDFVVVVAADYTPQDLGKFAGQKGVFERENLAVLGNSPLSGWRGAVELIDASASCISEVAYDVIEQSGLPLDGDIATNLYLGIEAGTRNFTKQGVSADTFAKVSNLLRQGAQRAPAKKPDFGPPRFAKGPQVKVQDSRDWQEQQRVFKGPTLP